MDIRKLQGFDSLIPKTSIAPAVGGAGEASGRTGNTGSVGGAEIVGPSFKDTLQKVAGQTTAFSAAAPITGAHEGVKFSNHAVERMKTRGIMYGPDEISKLNDAVAKADAKGSKNSLVLLDNSALIVSVKNKTVVTVMDKSALKENVFTNIDSTIVM